MTKRPKKPDYISQQDWDDVDSPEISDELFAKMRPVAEVAPELIALQEHVQAQRGRPKSLAPKQATNLRLSPHVLAHFKAKGAKWQTKINQALETVVAREQFDENRTAMAKKVPAKAAVKKATTPRSVAKSAAAKKPTRKLMRG